MRNHNQKVRYSRIVGFTPMLRRTTPAARPMPPGGMPRPGNVRDLLIRDTLLPPVELDHRYRVTDLLWHRSSRSGQRVGCSRSRSRLSHTPPMVSSGSTAGPVSLISTISGFRYAHVTSGASSCSTSTAGPTVGGMSGDRDRPVCSVWRDTRCRCLARGPVPRLSAEGGSPGRPR